MHLHRKHFMTGPAIALASLFIASSLFAEKLPTIMKTGKWLTGGSTTLIEAEIDEKTETICLPRIDLIGEIDHDKLDLLFREGIKPQDAVFHLYHDGCGTLKRSNQMLFASEVFLKDLKMTYTGYLRKSGFKFKINPVPAYDDNNYIKAAEANRYLRDRSYATSADVKAPVGETPAVSPAGDGVSLGGPAGFAQMPSQVLPKALRNSKEEVEEAIKELKSKGMGGEVITVDPVRWAGGRMGSLEPDGTIMEAYIEGRRLDLWIQPPEKDNWLNSSRQSELSGQPVEYILRRDQQGREILKDGKYHLADIYFVELGMTWDEWLESHSMELPEQPDSPDWATAPVSLHIEVVKGVWESLKLPVVVQVKVAKPIPGVKENELIRITPSTKRPKKFSDFQRDLDREAAGQFIDISMLMSPDGKPYTELGQKRALRIYFPEMKMTLFGIMDRITR